MRSKGNFRLMGGSPIDRYWQHSWQFDVIRHMMTAKPFSPSLVALAAFTSLSLAASCAVAGTVTWDGRHSTEAIEVTVVYFVPSDGTPLVDWRDRVDYFCRRIEQFHAREFHGQSTLTTRVINEPMISESTTAQLRNGDGDFTFFQTLREADRRLEFGEERGDAFPILLVLSDINWRPLDDFYRLHPGESGLEFEGNYNNGQHFPGATSGGARATYLSDQGEGLGAGKCRRLAGALPGKRLCRLSRRVRPYGGAASSRAGQRFGDEHGTIQRLD